MLNAICAGSTLTSLAITPPLKTMGVTVTPINGESESKYENRYRLELEVAYFEMSPNTEAGELT